MGKSVVDPGGEEGENAYMRKQAGVRCVALPRVRELLQVPKAGPWQAPEKPEHVWSGKLLRRWEGTSLIGKDLEIASPWSWLLSTISKSN